MSLPIIDDHSITERYTEAFVDATMRANGVVHVTGAVVRQIRDDAGKAQPALVVTSRITLSIEAAQDLARMLSNLLEKYTQERARPN